MTEANDAQPGSEQARFVRAFGELLVANNEEIAGWAVDPACETAAQVSLFISACE